jgi:hypothetical protein
MVDFGNAQIGQSFWKIMRDVNNVPVEIKEWILDSVGGAQNHCLYFNNAGDKEFAYAHHYNDDWFKSFAEAANAMQEDLNRQIAYARRRVEELEVIQKKLVDAIIANPHQQS